MEGRFQESGYLAKHPRSDFLLQKLQGLAIDGVRLSSSFPAFCGLYNAEGTVDNTCDV